MRVCLFFILHVVLLAHAAMTADANPNNQITNMGGADADFYFVGSKGLTTVSQRMLSNDILPTVLATKVTINFLSSLHTATRERIKKQLEVFRENHKAKEIRWQSKNTLYIDFGQEFSFAFQSHGAVFYISDN